MGKNGLAHIIYRSIIIAQILFHCFAINLLMAAFAHPQLSLQRIKSCSLWFSHYPLEILEVTAYA